MLIEEQRYILNMHLLLPVPTTKELHDVSLLLHVAVVVLPVEVISPELIYTLSVPFIWKNVKRL